LIEVAPYAVSSDLVEERRQKRVLRSVPSDMELPGAIQPQAKQQDWDRTPKDKVEDHSNKIVVSTPVKRTVRVGYLLLFSSQLVEPPSKDQRSDRNPNLQRNSEPVGLHRFPDRSQAADRRPPTANRLPLGRGNGKQLAQPTSAVRAS
jgi:hypothetical protein